MDQSYYDIYNSLFDKYVESIIQDDTTQNVLRDDGESYGESNKLDQEE